ncbi:MAG TPA: hypothetical protein VFM25_12685 [Verrucomicrobiae bacterium]|nr:hypothetical protein [Verrucomicrobiae bacterium]
MKKLGIIGLLVVIVDAFLLLYRQHFASVARFDIDFRQHLTRVWLRQETGMRCTNTFVAYGSFVELSWFSHPDRTNTYWRTCTWIVKDGCLIEKIKSSTNPSGIIPHTNGGGRLFIQTRESLSLAGRILWNCMAESYPMMPNTSLDLLRGLSIAQWALNVFLLFSRGVNPRSAME